MIIFFLFELMIIYIMPNYLIIILNRGKGNIFNCNVQILESFSPSNYVEKEKNIVLEDSDSEENEINYN